MSDMPELDARIARYELLQRTRRNNYYLDMIDRLTRERRSIINDFNMG